MNPHAQELLYGIDLDHDGSFAPDAIRDVASTEAGDPQWLSGLIVLQQELERLFHLTPKGSLVDDPTYGINWPIGEPILDVQAKVGLVQSAVGEALRHPSFRERFSVRACRGFWLPSTPTSIYVIIELELFHFQETWTSVFEFEGN